MNCTGCGSRLEPGAAFCPNCGTAVPRSGTATTTTTPTSAPPQATVSGPVPAVYTSPVSTSETSGLAIASLALGIASWLVAPFLGALGAIITGHMARSEIKGSRGRVGGDGMALAGLILGYGNLVVGCLAFFVLMLVFGGLAAIGAGAGH